MRELVDRKELVTVGQDLVLTCDNCGAVERLGDRYTTTSTHTFVIEREQRKHEFDICNGCIEKWFVAAGLLEVIDG